MAVILLASIEPTRNERMDSPKDVYWNGHSYLIIFHRARVGICKLPVSVDQ